MTSITKNNSNLISAKGILKPRSSDRRVAVFALTGQIDQELWAERLRDLGGRFEISWLEADRVRSVVRLVLTDGSDIAVHPLSDDIEQSLRLLRCISVLEPRPQVVVLSDIHSPQLEKSVRQLGGVVYTIWPEDRGDLLELLSAPVHSRSAHSAHSARRVVPRSLMA